MKLERIADLPVREYRQGDKRVVAEGELDPVLLDGIEEAIGRLDTVFGGRFYDIFDGLTVAILSDTIEGGGRVDAEQRYIQVDYAKNKLALSKVERFLVDEGTLEQGDWVRLAADATAAGSFFPVNFIHEVGHITGTMAGRELDPALSPTKYGRSAPHEAFAEAFTYFVYDQPQASEAEQAVREAIGIVCAPSP